MSDNNRKKDGGSGMAIGIALGLCLSAAVGTATNNIGLWIPAGMCLGMAIGTAFRSSDEDGGEDE